jgi:hypothetical protein
MAESKSSSKSQEAKAAEQPEAKPSESKASQEPKDAPPAPPAPPESPDETFPVSQLVANAPDFLGVESYVAAGGLYGQKKDLSVADAKQKIDAWLEKPLTEEA